MWSRSYQSEARALLARRFPPTETVRENCPDDGAATVSGERRDRVLLAGVVFTDGCDPGPLAAATALDDSIRRDDTGVFDDECGNLCIGPCI